MVRRLHKYLLSHKHDMLFARCLLMIYGFLSEPTSALDAQSSVAVEEYIVDLLKSTDSNLKAAVWITHSEEQAKRVGTRFLRIANGTIQ